MAEERQTLVGAVPKRGAGAMTPARSDRGFTLTELLVVVAVIATLAGIVSPVLLTGRAKARQAVCMSNLRQLGHAFQAYLLDHDEIYPDAGDCGRNPDASWVRAPEEYHIDVRGGGLFPYVGDERVYRCPDDPNAGRTRLSYSFNDWIRLLPEAGLPHPSSTILLLEEDPGSARGTGLNDGAFHFERPADIPAEYHSGRGDWLWCDGHVGSRPPAALTRHFDDGP